MNRGFSFLKNFVQVQLWNLTSETMSKLFLLVIIFFISFGGSFAQYTSGRIGIAMNAVYTTSAEVFLNPNSSDLEARNKSFLLEDIWNPGIDIRYRFSAEFILGLNVEYIEKTTNLPNLTAFIGNQVYVFEVEDGFRTIPVELTAYYFFPFSTDHFKFLMGGGLGYYYGQFIRKFSDVDLEVTQRKITLGILVATSLDYMIFDNLSARFEMKFRNPQYNVTSKYTKTEIEYQGNQIQLSENPFETKVDINGLTFVLGVVVHI
jgi:outer membrane protein W